MFHVHYKPLWAAIGEPDNRFRKPTAQGRMIERVMLLDAVLDDREFTWLGPSMDKRRHFIRHLGDRLELRDYPHLLFGDGPEKTVRYFPDKLPIGMQPHADTHVFVYLVTRPSPMDFRLFLLRHVPLLRVLFRWTVRLLLPRKLVKARLAYLHAAREQLATPLHPSVVETLEWLFPERKRLAEPGAGSAERTRDRLQLRQIPRRPAEEEVEVDGGHWRAPQGRSRVSYQHGFQARLIEPTSNFREQRASIHEGSINGRSGREAASVPWAALCHADRGRGGQQQARRTQQTRDCHLAG